MMKELNTLYDELNEMFGKKSKKYSKLRSDILEGKDEYIILTDIPGVNKEDIILSFDNKTLTIEVKESDEKENDLIFRLNERRRLFSPKKIYIEKEVDASNIKASYENGVLKITINKMTPKKANIIIE